MTGLVSPSGSDAVQVKMIVPGDTLALQYTIPT